MTIIYTDVYTDNFPPKYPEQDLSLNIFRINPTFRILDRQIIRLSAEIWILYRQDQYIP